MISLNVGNVEDLIFLKSDARQLLPEFQQIFDQWKFAMTVSLRSLRIKSALDFLNSINETHMETLKLIVGDEIRIDKLNYNLTEDLTTSITELEDKLNQRDRLDNFVCFREGDQVYISFWR